MGGRLPVFRRGTVVITQFRCILDENSVLPNIEQSRKQYGVDIAFFQSCFEVGCFLVEEYVSLDKAVRAK